MPVSVERPEISIFLDTWKDKPKEQFAEELASYSLETKRIPDPYYFEITPTGELFSPTAYCKVKDSVEDKTGSLGKLEYQAVLAIEQWAARNSEGSAVWVSPPYSGIYPTAKIIISQIEQQSGIKRLFNRAILLDYDEKECLQFAQGLAKLSENRPLLSHLDQVRATPLMLNTHGNSWIYILQELIDDPSLWESINKGVDQRAKKEALRQATKVQNDIFISSKPIDAPNARIAIIQMLGSKQGSCPVVLKSTAFGVFSRASFTVGSGSSVESDQYGSLEFECPKCKAINRRPKGQLIPSCHHCNADVRC